MLSAPMPDDEPAMTRRVRACRGKRVALGGGPRSSSPSPLIGASAVADHPGRLRRRRPPHPPVRRPGRPRGRAPRGSAAWSAPLERAGRTPPEAPRFASRGCEPEWAAAGAIEQACARSPEGIDAWAALAAAALGAKSSWPRRATASSSPLQPRRRGAPARGLALRQTPPDDRACCIAHRDAVAAEPTFDVLPLGAEVRRAIDAMGYKHPTPVQLAVFEPAAEGRSLVVQARTGTGKTAAFGLPIVDRLVRAVGQGRAGAGPLPDARARAPGVARARAARAVPGHARSSPSTAARRWAADRGARGGRADRRRHARAACSTTCAAGRSTRPASASSSSTRPTRCSRWASRASSTPSSRTLPKNRQGLFFSATIPPDIERLAHTHLQGRRSSSRSRATRSARSRSPTTST